MQIIKYATISLLVAGAAYSQERSKYKTPKPFDLPGINLTLPSVKGPFQPCHGSSWDEAKTKPTVWTSSPMGGLWPIPLEDKGQKRTKTTPADSGTPLRPEIFEAPMGRVTKLIPQFDCAITNLGQGNVPMGARCEVRRNGKLIGNIVVGRVEANRAICKVRKHDMTTPLMVGDTVTVANTKTAKTR